MENTVQAAPARGDVLPRVHGTGRELKRGLILNTVALVTANFRGIFTFLVARLLGPPALGIFSVAWATADLISKIGIFGLDDATTTFIARADAMGETARARTLFRLATVLVVIQSAVVAFVSIAAVQLLRGRFGLEPQLVSALSLLLIAVPGIALYRIGTSASRAMKVMQHDVYSRGVTDSVATTLAFLIALAVGLTTSAPQIAAIIGITASGLVAFALASSLFRKNSQHGGSVSLRAEIGPLLAYAAPIGAYQFLNAFILRLDLIMLAWFIGRAPGVTLVTVGVYSAVIDIASASRKVNQAFYPIFAPIVAGMTATGEHERASATYRRLAQWMLWILLPLVAVMLLSGETILMIFGSAFRQGSLWLGIVAIACATNAFIGLAETAIMVQRPRLNLLHSSITCVIGVAANLLLIPRFGVTGAAFGILIPYVVQGILRWNALRLVFHWPNPWRAVTPPILAALAAFIPALVCRTLLEGIAAQITAVVLFLVTFGLGWTYYRLRFRSRPDE